MLHRLLPRTSLRDPSTRRVLDLGVLYNSLYRFWLHRGAWGLTLHSLVSVLNCFALWIFSFAFFFMVDWTLVTSCVGDECGKRSLLHSPSLDDLTGRQSFLSLCFLLSCAASLGYELKQFIEVTCIASELHRDLRQYVKVGDRTPFHGVWYRARAWMWGAQGHSLIPDTRGDEEMSSFTAHDEERVGRVMLDIDDVTWDDFLHHVIVRIIRKDSGVSNRQQVDELRVVQTMLVVENYLVALHSHHFFRRGSVLWWANQAVINELVRAQFSFGRLLDVDRAVEESLAGLRLGLLLSILLYPLVVSFFFAKLLVRYVAVTRSNPRYLVEHEWTPEALWAFRLYNELPHLYDHRIRSASTKFNDVLDSVAPPSVFSRFPRRAAEIFILLLVIVGIVNGTVITTGNFGGRAVVWWLSVGLVIYGTTASTTRAREATHRTSAYFDAVSTLYYEDATWRQSTAAFRDCISRHFLWPRALVALREFFSILLMPVVVCMLYTRGEAELRKMAIFLEENSVWVDGVGHVCSLAAFDTEPAAGMVSTNDLDDVNDSLDGSANGSGDVTPPQDNSAVRATVPRDERGYSAVGETSSSGRQLVHHLTTALHANLTKIPIPRALGGRGVAKNGAEPTMERVDSTDDAVAVINMKTPRPAAPDVTKFNLTSSARDALRSVVPSNKGAEERNSPPVGDAYDVFIGAIEADTVPAAIAAQKQHVSLVQFAAVHSHWAHHASQYGKTQVVRDLAAIVASTDPSASPEPRCTASRVTMTSHDVAHWHIAHYAAAATAATPRTQTSSPAPPPIRVTTTTARDSDDEERP